MFQEEVGALRRRKQDLRARVRHAEKQADLITDGILQVLSVSVFASVFMCVSEREREKERGVLHALVLAPKPNTPNVIQGCGFWVRVPVFRNGK